MRYSFFPKYVSVAAKKATALKKLAQLRDKNPAIRPVTLKGHGLARTWWGKGWNANLERYADYSNRIGRGRSYVRHGAVLDLQIAAGEIRALVQGSRSKPYEVMVTIKALVPAKWQKIKECCQGRIEALPDLLAGRFPAELADIFMAAGEGLFPAPAEISFQCSCPDWANMCKHVAATLYGVGARLDEEPALFFTLRRVEMADLIAGAVRESSARILADSTRKSARVMEDGDLGALFGIDLAYEPLPFTESPPVNVTQNQAPHKMDKPINAKKTAKSSNSAKSSQSGKTRLRRAGERKPKITTDQKVGKKAAATPTLYSKTELCAILEKMLRDGVLPGKDQSTPNFNR